MGTANTNYNFAVFTNLDNYTNALITGENNLTNAANVRWFFENHPIVMPNTNLNIRIYFTVPPMVR